MPERRLTVLMSVRNGEPFVREAVESILGQTFRDFRFLIMDNASTDSSLETISAFQDPRIDLVPLPNDLGQTGALNLGLSLVDTPYVARMDADDVSLATRLEEQMDYLQTHPTTALLGAGAMLIDAQGRPMYRMIRPGRRPDILDAFTLYNPFLHSSVVFKTEAVRRFGGYDPLVRYFQDLDLWLKIASEYPVANLEKVLVLLRVHGARASFDPNRAVRLREELASVQKVAALPGLSKAARNAAWINSALLVMKMGRRKEAVRYALRAFHKAPTGFMLNRLLWKRLGITILFQSRHVKSAVAARFRRTLGQS